MSDCLVTPIMKAPLPAIPFTQWQATFRDVFEQRLIEALDARLADMPPRLSDAVRYAVLDGGKRLRPMLVLLGYALTANPDISGALPDPTDNEFAAVWPAAIAIELIHGYSLVHDDLPAMDDDDLRRGKPTVHRAFDEATAILAGDVLQTLAFDLLLQEIPDYPVAASVQLAWTRLLARGSVEMVSGQQLDLNPSTTPSEQELGHMHNLKTGALLRSALLMGAAAGRTDGSVEASLEAFIVPLGLAFQIQDDILDETGTVAQLGKTPGKDAAQAKSSYVTVLGLERARQRLTETIDAALAALVPLGNAADPLRACAHFVLTRNH